MKNIILKTLFIIATITTILCILSMENTIKVPAIISTICLSFISLFAHVNRDKWIFK